MYIGNLSDAIMVNKNYRFYTYLYFLLITSVFYFLFIVFYILVTLKLFHIKLRHLIVFYLFVGHTHDFEGGRDER